MNTTNNLVLNLMSCFKLKLVLCDSTSDIHTNTANNSSMLSKGKQPSKKVIKSSLGKFYYNSAKQHTNNYNTYYTTSHSNNNTTHKHHTNISTPLNNQSTNNSFLEYQNPLSHSYCLDNNNSVHTNVFKVSHTRSNSNTLSNPFSLSKTNSTKNIRKPKLFTSAHPASHKQEQCKSKSKPSFVNINVNINKESSSPSSLPQSSRVAELFDKDQSPLQNSDCLNKGYKHFTDLKNDFVIFYTEEYVPSITNDLLKLECELCIDKSLELFKAYHMELNELKLRYETYKDIYVKWSKKYLNIKKKLFELQIDKEKNQINTFYKMYIVKTKSTQNKEIDIKTNKQEMLIIKGLVHEKENQMQLSKTKLKEIIRKICTANEQKVSMISDAKVKEYVSGLLKKNNSSNSNSSNNAKKTHHKSNSNVHHKKLKYSYSGSVNVNRVNATHSKGHKQKHKLK